MWFQQPLILNFHSIYLISLLATPYSTQYYFRVAMRSFVKKKITLIPFRQNLKKMQTRFQHIVFRYVITYFQKEF